VIDAAVEREERGFFEWRNPTRRLVEERILTARRVAV
jgi:hypothetical protein